MTKVQTVTVELQRPGPPHNQLLSPLTPYLAMCGSRAANTVYLEFEHHEFLHQTKGLDYTLTPDYQRGQLSQSGKTIGKLLASIQSLPAAIAEAVIPNSDEEGLIHLRLISDAAELAMLPFEAALAPQGFPGEGQPLLLQSAAPICLTRESRNPEKRELKYFDREQRILFAYAEFPGYSVPVRAHLAALRRAIDPWCNKEDPQEKQAWARAQITVLANASLEAIRSACAKQKYCYVHLLAHGVPRGEGGEQKFGLALHSSRDPASVDIVDGERLAEALCGFDARGEDWWCPKVVTIAACDSGHQGSVIVPGGSVAHAAHLAGVPLVVASQFPLTKRGSALLTDVLYRGLLWGEDPFVLMHEVRRRLHIDSRDSLDWASLVVYSAWTESLETNTQMFRYNQAVDALEAIAKRLRSRASQAASPAALKLDLERLEDFQARMRQIAPVIRTMATNDLYFIDSEAATLAEHNLDCAATRLQAQAVIRQAELRRQLGDVSWRDSLRGAYDAIIELQERSQQRRKRLPPEVLLLIGRIAIVLHLRFPQEESEEILADLSKRLSGAPSEGAQGAERMPLWLRATQAELLILSAKQHHGAQELGVLLPALKELAGASMPDELGQVQYAFHFYTDWWKDYMPKEVVDAAQRVLEVLELTTAVDDAPKQHAVSATAAQAPHPAAAQVPAATPAHAPSGKRDPLLVFGDGAEYTEDFLSCCCLRDQAGEWFGSGVVIADGALLTAKHCLNNLRSGSPVAQVLIGGSRISTAQDSQIWDVAASHAHPADSVDLALIILKPQSQRGTSRISLHEIATPIASTAELEAATSFTMVGFGASNPTNNEGFGIKRKIKLQRQRLTSSELWAGISGKADTSHGDSGGPALVGGPLVYRLAGVTSGAAPEGKGGIYVRVDQYRGWIEARLAEHGLALAD